MNNKLKVITLFSGYGTQELALKYANINYEVIANCDILKSANAVYDALHTTSQGNLLDITKVDENNFPESDFLTYSFPCQDISISGIQKGIKKGSRSGLLYEVERILTVNKPKYLLMENVKNLLNKKHMPQFNKHIEFLNSIGYGCAWLLLNGADYGCPQNRERVFMLSIYGETNEYVRDIMANVTSLKKDRIPMRSFIEDNVDDSLFINSPYRVKVPKTDSTCKVIGIREDIKYEQAQRIYSIDACSPCLTTSGSPQIMLDDHRFRTITAREGYRFMGVKDEDIDLILNNTNFSHRIHVSLAGNSICVPVMSAIFSFVFESYKNNNLITAD